MVVAVAVVDDEPDEEVDDCSRRGCSGAWNHFIARKCVDLDERLVSLKSTSRRNTLRN